ncbi:oleate hydratase [Periweissella ghanensis]|uniref:Oleate hydratase n=1 Tax=Periweissella ghanensis TaxID=467997 RepID=A0ABM8Z992_9LACO|nr:oleate hydratase [Periweissella ghanensis]MCM0601126.1 oleate hydratase [Periweissella ghanensis]CAH0417791.1 Oleate hydratase [Periweissella ghanensis]
MYYSNGNYEAFARPRKPAGVDQKSAYIVGGGLAGLAAAAFLVRDGHMAGERIHVFEELAIPGGALDGALNPDTGFIIRGGREMENHFECLWDLYHSIPSLEVEDASVLDEFYWLDKDDPNSSNCRLIYKNGQEVPDDGEFTLGKATAEIIKLVMTPEDALIGQSIEDFFSDEFFASNFWYYWCSMFAFERWHSAQEMRRYVMRFIHHVKGLPDFTALKFTRYNQYESLVLPLIKYLENHGVDFQYDTIVKNVEVEINGDEKVAKRIFLVQAGAEKTLDLTPDDLVFVTNGSITESTTHGSHHQPAIPNPDMGASWQLWQNLAQQSPEFGKPDVFSTNLPAQSWYISATVTLKNEDVIPYLERLTNRDTHSGKIVTGGIVTVRDSNWLMSFCVHRQPHFKQQNPDETIMWVYALLSDEPGNYVNKKIVDCTGEEIAQELFYHLGVPAHRIKEFAANSCNVVPTYMPFITSYFMKREPGDRPLVIPNGSKNLAFIGNFAETERDTVFTTEYSVRTAMEAVYQLLDVERGVPEVFASVYDIRELLKSIYVLSDGKTIDELDIPVPRFAKRIGRRKIEGTFIEELLKQAKLID